MVLAKVGEYMKLIQIKNRAKNLGIEPGKLKKAELIHAIQCAEGNSPCFGTSDGNCPYTNCCFYTDCLKLSKKNMQPLAVS